MLIGDYSFSKNQHQKKQLVLLWKKGDGCSGWLLLVLLVVAQKVLPGKMPHGERCSTYDLQPLLQLARCRKSTITSMICCLTSIILLNTSKQASNNNNFLSISQPCMLGNLSELVAEFWDQI